MCVASVGASVNFLLVLSEVRTKKVDWPTVRVSSDQRQEVRVLDRSRNTTKPEAQAINKRSFISIKDWKGWKYTQ